MATIIYRILRQGFQTFWRQKLLSFATMTVIILTLTGFLGLSIFNSVGQAALDSIQEKIDISVYFKTNAPEDEILRIKKSLEGLTEVKNVDYISRDKALEIFQARHANEENVSRAITELGDNPLSASLNIKAKDPKDYAVIASYLGNASLDNLVENISYNQNKVVIDRLTKIISVSRLAGFAVTLVLTLIAIFVAFNTILIGIYSNREEINIMRMVGASNMFIRGPYLVEGIIYGGISAVVSLLVAAPVVYLTSPYVKVFVPGFDLGSYFLGNLFSIFLYQLVFGIVIGIVSSFIALRKYLTA